MLLDKDKGLCRENMISKPGNGSQGTDLEVCKLATENVGVAQLASKFGLCNWP
jgi:hypothetical protein